MIALPAIAFLLFFLILRKRGVDPRRSFLAAATFCGASVVLITESLSVPRLVTRGGVAISWLVISAIGLMVYLKIERSAIGLPSRPQTEVAPEGEGDGLDRMTKALLYAAGVIVVLVGITALVAPPSNLDAMSYHMARVAMWICNHNVGFFPTANYTQLIYGAFAEYSMMHTMLLWGNDRFVNMVQFFSFIGCAIAVSYITKLLGGSRRAQAIAAVVCITIPEGILEASGPMNTYTSCFWIATATAFLLAWNEDASWLNAICIGLASGLALFTKGTTYILLPFIVLACWWMSSRPTRILFLKRGAIIVGLMLAINAPQYLRNYRFDGSPLGVPLDFGELQLTIQNIGVRSTAANILRNISLHAGSPSGSLNVKIEHAFRAAIRSIGVDPDDRRQVVFKEPFSFNHMSFNELVAGDPLHLFLLIVALGIVFVKFKDEKRQLFWYSLSLTSAFVVFSALLKWQRWSSRFHLQFFVLGAVIIALAFVRYLPRKLVTAIAMVLLVGGLFNASMNRFRSLIPVGRWLSAYGPRPMLYFAYENEHLAPSYIAAAEAVDKTDCESIGIDTYTPLTDHEIEGSPDSFFSYPIVALTHSDGRARTAFFSGVHNLTARYAAEQPHPPACAIICLDCAKVPSKWQEYGSFPNHQVYESVVVFSSASLPVR
jgi:hypothetical protein